MRSMSEATMLTNSEVDPPAAAATTTPNARLPPGKEFAPGFSRERFDRKNKASALDAELYRRTGGKEGKRHEQHPEDPSMFLGALRGAFGGAAHSPLPRLPGRNPMTRREEHFREWLTVDPKRAGEIRHSVSVRRRGLSPKLSISKQQVREVNASTPQLDVWGFLRPDSSNPLVPDEEDERKRRPKPRQEPHYYQERPINYSTTCTIATVHAGTTRF